MDILLEQEKLTERRRAIPKPKHIGDVVQNGFTKGSPEVHERFIEPPTKRPERVTLDQLDQTHPTVKRAVKIAYAWAARKKDGRYDNASMVLYGPNGIGKTHIARAIWWSMTKAPESPNGHVDTTRAQPEGRFLLSNDLISQMGQTRDSETGLVTSAYASTVIGPAPILVIDDVGAEQNIPFVAKEDQEHERQTRFFKAIDHCYTFNISVILTTNLTIQDTENAPGLATHLGRRAFDRLLEMAPKTPQGNFFVNMSGVPSYRRTKGGR